MIKSLETEWKDFESKVIHPDAGQNQRDQMKAAFFGGSSP